MNSPLRIRSAAAALAAVALVGLTGCRGKSEHAAAPLPATAAVPVDVVMLEPVSVADGSEFTGTVEPWTRSSPGTKILGRVDRVAVREGDRVGRGDVLAMLERRDLDAAVAQARAAVSMAQAQLDNADAMFRRMTDLHGRGSATAKNLEDATAGQRVAQAAVEQAQANLRAAEVTVGYAEVRSPIAGIVVEKRIEAGDMAAPGMPMFTVEDLSKVKVTFQIPEAQVVRIARGDRVHLAFDSLGESVEAEVDRVAPSADRQSRTYEVEVVTSNEGGRLQSGMFARVRFDHGVREALHVPEGAIVRRGQLEGVFVVGDDGRARIRWVQLRPAGRRPEDGREVLSGLAAGERIVAQAAADLADGIPVTAR